MPQYKYTAKKGPGTLEEGYIEANSLNGAIAKLSDQGYFPLTVVQAGKDFELTGVKLKSSLNHLVFFTRELGDLLESGVPMIQALRILKNETRKKSLKYLIQSIELKMLEGASFSDSLKAFPGFFSPFFIHATLSGEVSGTLSQVLSRLGQYYEKNRLLRKKILNALLYPSFLFGMGLLAVSVLIFMVVPKLEPLFADLGVKKPLITEIVLNMSQFFAHTLPLWVLGLSLSVLGLIQMFKHEHVRGAFQNKLLNVPFLGTYLKNRYLSEVFQSLYSLIDNGVSVDEAVEITARSCQFLPIKESLFVWIKHLRQGDTLYGSLQKITVFPENVSALIKVGEETGNLERSLLKLSNHFMDHFDADSDHITKFLGPVLIMLIGVMVAVIVSAMILPLLSINMNL